MPDLTTQELRQRNRKFLRDEYDLPKVKWAAFQEQRRHEDMAAMRFSQKQDELRYKLSHPNPDVQMFIARLKRCLNKKMKESGGTEQSIIRATFLHWDADNSGEISPDEFIGALRSLGLIISQREADVVVRYYDVRGSGEMKYQPLVEDITRGSRHFIHHPEVPSARPADDFVSGSARPKKKDPTKDPFITAFLEKLRKKLWNQMRKKGDYERTLIRRAFLQWDKDASGKLNVDELRGAMSQLGMHLSLEESRRIVDFYDLYHVGEMTYKELVEDVSRGIPSFIEHPESEGKNTLDKPTSQDLQVGGRMFTSRRTARSENALVEKFKVRLRTCLEKTTHKVGGTIPMILREAFLFWDATSTGKLEPKEFRGAIGRVGLVISLEDAKQIVAYYDRDGSGEMEYHELVDDVGKESLDFIAHETTRPSYREAPSARIPGPVRTVLDKIGMGARIGAQRSSLRISPYDLLHGTFLRYDSTSTGFLSGSDLARAMHELKVELGADDIARLVNWYDESASRTVRYSKVASDAVGGPSSSRVTPAVTSRGSARKTAILAEKAKIEQRLAELSVLETSRGTARGSKARHQQIRATLARR